MIRIWRFTPAFAVLALGLVAIPPGNAGAFAAARNYMSAGSAKPVIGWSKVIGPISGAKTSMTPALAGFAGPHTGVLLVWSSTNSNLLKYATSTNVAGNRWSSPAPVGKALAGTTPAAAPFGGASSDLVLVAWQGRTNRAIDYDIGTVGKGDVIGWGPALMIPGARTSTGPAVYGMLHSDRVFISWRRAGSNSINYVVGTPATGHSPVKWSAVRTLPSAATTDRPAVTEVSTGKTAGKIYLLWRGPPGKDRIYNSSTSDPLTKSPQWSKPKPLPGSMTVASPAAMSDGPGYGFPLVVIFRAVQGSKLMYLTVSANGRVSSVVAVPSAHSLQPVTASPNAGIAFTNHSDVFPEIPRPCSKCT